MPSSQGFLKGIVEILEEVQKGAQEVRAGPSEPQKVAVQPGADLTEGATYTPPEHLTEPEEDYDLVQKTPQPKVDQGDQEEADKLYAEIKASLDSQMKSLDSQMKSLGSPLPPDDSPIPDNDDDKSRPGTHSGEILADLIDTLGELANERGDSSHSDHPEGRYRSEEHPLDIRPTLPTAEELRRKAEGSPFADDPSIERVQGINTHPASLANPFSPQINFCVSEPAANISQGDMYYGASHSSDSYLEPEDAKGLPPKGGPQIGIWMAMEHKYDMMYALEDLPRNTWIQPKDRYGNPLPYKWFVKGDLAMYVKWL